MHRMRYEQGYQHRVDSEPHHKRPTGRHELHQDKEESRQQDIDTDTLQRIVDGVNPLAEIYDRSVAVP